ncbi:hypothetical protein JYB88_05970 [Shewanella cyperi]|uniref:Tetratricopeptide repeat protein n=2 Tax=Shewanella TaxID=22 RepID=A0A974XMQ8_9GAMM|nr:MULTISPECIES: hypothetical protein [Shewanella]QSX31184.1 hypothetical protein JYB88_05970 [Shewanella cyperi]QSX38412.1 hypothetical protein JYB85_06210 [Shewanella sedimentimangrovi]
MITSEQEIAKDHLRLPLWLVVAAVFISVFAVYFPALDAGLVFDDLAMIPGNGDHLGHWSKLPDFFVTGVWNHSNIAYADGSLYRPLWLVWELLMYQVAGEAPFGWHLSNLLLHGLNGCLLYLLLGRVGNHHDLWRLGLVLLFLLHPVASQNVAWISASTDLLLVLWLALAMLSYHDFYRHGSLPGLLLSLLCYLLAMFTKEAAIAFPVFLLMLEWQRPVQRRFPWAAAGAFALLTLGYLLLRQIILQGMLSGGQSLWLWQWSSLWRMLDYAATYARVLLWPWDLPLTRDHPPQGVGTALDYGLGLLLWLAALLSLIRVPRTRPYLALIIAALGIPLLLAFHGKGAFAVRYLYLPLFALCLLLGQLRPKTPGGKPAALLFSSVLLLLACVTHFRELPGWRTQADFARVLLKYHPSADNWNTLVQARIDAGDMAGAIEDYDKARDAVQTRSQEPAALAGSLEAIAFALAQQQNYGQSLKYYRELAGLPGFAYLGWTGAANCLWALQRLPEASDAYLSALQDKPEHLDALYNLFMLSQSLNRPQQAQWAAQAILRQNPAQVPEEISAAARRYLQRANAGR